MFQNATSFNQSIGNWDVSKVKSMESMFESATNFDQPIGNWNVSGVTNFNRFMNDKNPFTFSAPNLTDIYTGWTSGGKTVQSGIDIRFGTANYTTAGQTARDILTNTYNWTITDGGPI